jgi:hypothetical protein
VESLPARRFLTAGFATIVNVSGIHPGLPGELAEINRIYDLGHIRKIFRRFAVGA